MKILVVIKNAHYKRDINSQLACETRHLRTWIDHSIQNNTDGSDSGLGKNLTAALLTQIEQCRVRKYIGGPVFDSPTLSIFAPYDSTQNFTAKIRGLFAAKQETPYLNNQTYNTLVLTVMWEPRAFLIKLAKELDVVARSTMRYRVILFSGIETDNDQCANLQKIGRLIPALPQWDKVLVLTTPNNQTLNSVQLHILNHLETEFDTYLAIQVETCNALFSGREALSPQMDC